jgi:hypothetical protein
MTNRIKEIEERLEKISFGNWATVDVHIFAAHAPDDIRYLLAREKEFAELDKMHADLVTKYNAALAELKKAREESAELRRERDNERSIKEAEKKIMLEEVANNAVLTAELAANAKMLARQCDLARQAEIERDGLRARLEAVVEISKSMKLLLILDDVDKWDRAVLLTIRQAIKKVAVNGE